MPVQFVDRPSPTFQSPQPSLAWRHMRSGPDCPWAHIRVVPLDPQRRSDFLHVCSLQWAIFRAWLAPSARCSNFAATLLARLS